MAKKFVRGVTGIEDIESFDKTLTNVNDLLSDGQNTYVHTKKGKVESYYNLTDNVKTIQSSGGTITVEKDENGTVNLKTNPQKVLEHDNLVSVSEYVTIKHDVDYNTSQIETGKLNNDMNQLYSSLAQKQNKIISSLSVGVSSSGGFRQLYAYPQTFTSENGVLKTRIKSLANFSTLENPEQEFNFIIKINKGATSATFTLNDQALTKFTKIINTYGSNNTVRISGCVFTLSGSTLTVSTTSNTAQNYVITFSDII